MFYQVSLHSGMVLMMLLSVRVSMNSIVVCWTFIFVRENSATEFMVLHFFLLGNTNISVMSPRVYNLNALLYS
jgi:hypothetical protein